MRLRPIRIGILAALSALAWSGAAAAASELADLPLEDLLETQITSASKRPQKPADAPSMVSVITAEEIRRFGWRTLGEALASLRGVQVSYDRSYSYLGVRGFARPGDYNARLLLLIDGTPINDSVYDQAQVGSEFPLDLALIERIEYVPGPGSVLYGGNAFFGVINVVTASGAQRGKELELGTGPGHLWEARATVGDRSANGGDWLVSVSRRRQRGADLYFDAYAAPGANATSHGLDWDNGERLFARYQRGGLALGLLAHDRHKGVPGGAYATELDDPLSRQNDHQVQGWVHYDHHLDATWQLSLAGWASQGGYRGDWIAGGVPEVDHMETAALGGEARLITTALPQRVTVAGISWRHDGTRRQFNAFMDDNRPRKTWGVFVQDDWQATNHLALSLGLRHDSYSGDRSFLSPRLAVIAQLGPQTTLKGIVGRAFRPPNGYETDYVYGGSNIPNPNLAPERIFSRELGLTHFVAPQIGVSASLYDNHIADLIAPELDPQSGLQQHHNVGRVHTRGFEIEGHARHGELSLRGSVSWQHAQHESGTPLPNTPRQLAKLLVATPLAGGPIAAWETQYVGRRLTDSGEMGIAGEAVGGHTVSHLTLSGRHGNMGWQVRLVNVFNRRYGDVVGTEFSAAWPDLMVTPMPTMQQDGRGLFLRLRWLL